MTKAQKLRELFKENNVIRIVGAHNGLGAKLIEKHGFEGIWASGLEVSTSHAVPDANILTMTDYLNAAISMNDATSLPVIVDADTGYGNSNNVIQMVRKFEAAGIAAVCIEDKLFPKVNSFIPGRQELASIPEFVGKIMAAKNNQKTKDFMVFSRVEALIAGWGLDEAYKRAKTYVEAGSDGVFIHSKSKDSKEIEDFVKRWDLDTPLIICPTTYSNLTLDDIKKMQKIKMVIYANHGIRASINAMNNVLNEISSAGTTKTVEGKIASMKEVFELQGMPKMKESEKLYLKKGKDVKVIIPAAGDPTKEDSLKEILKNTPTAMLDINGKSVLQRAVEALNNCEIQDITVVSGHGADKIVVDGVNIIKNSDYKETGILNSIMQAEKKMDKNTLIVFSDVLFDKEIVEKLISRNSDIVLAVDPSFKTARTTQKKLDFVVAENSPDHRSLQTDKENHVLKIGKNIEPSEAQYEFIGLAYFSENGVKELKNLYNKENLKTSFTDIIQKLIDEGVKVDTVEINKGWAEIHTMDDYKRACSLLGK